MLILKYFLTMGAVLLAGLLTLTAYVAPSRSNASAYTPSTDSLPLIAPAQPKVEQASLVEEPAPPQAKKAVSEPRRSKHRKSRRHGRH
jgi:hypothetical protein